MGATSIHGLDRSSIRLWKPANFLRIISSVHIASPYCVIIIVGLMSVLSLALFYRADSALAFVQKRSEEVKSSKYFLLWITPTWSSKFSDRFLLQIFHVYLAVSVDLSSAKYDSKAK